MGDDFKTPDKTKTKAELCAVKPCPKPPPKPKKKVFVFVVELVEKHTGTPVSGVRISASGSKNLGSKTTSNKGLADFGNVDEGSNFNVVLELTTNENRKYLANPKNFPGTPAQVPGSKPFKIEIETRLLNLISVDEIFAPGIEKLEIKYDIQGLSDQTVVLAISSDKYAGKLISKLNLTADQKSSGKGKVLLLDIKGTEAGKLKDKFLSPLFSPFKVTLKVEKSAPLNIDLSGDKPTKVEIDHVDFAVDAPGDKLFMNNPEQNFLVTNKVFIKKKAGGFVLTPIEIEVFYTHTEGASNTTAVNSYVYSGVKTLGKKGDASALYWKKHPDCDANSTDGFKLNCSAITRPSGADMGVAKINFLPSGVGGDTYKVKSEIFDATKGSLDKKESNNLVVWRAVRYERIYEMQGLTHVSVNATEALIAPTFVPPFVKYTVGARTAIDATHSVKYVGLWKDSTTPQESWATLRQKQADETPTAAEILNANYTGPDLVKIALRAADRTRIIAKAQKWVQRIDSAYFAAQAKWVHDAGLLPDCLVAIQYYHPKYSLAGGDSVTNQWNLYGTGTPAWLRVNTYSNSYTGIDPDSGWVRGGLTFAGLSIGNGRVLIPTGLAAATIQQSVKHESGHATKSFFKRQNFVGVDGLDHSASIAGIMYFQLNGGTTFTAEEIKVLKGIKP